LPIQKLHSAALALVGWYLISPPVYHSDDYKAAWAVTNAPLSQWTSTSFDTATACETELANQQSINEHGTAHLKDPLSVAITKSEQMLMCIASDDPRLKN
jgi:hypothetical protein